MTFNPNSLKSIDSMLKELNLEDFNSLFNFIPKELLFKDKFNISDSISEFDISNELKKISLDNQVDKKIYFTGKGIYDHFIPSVVDFISMRSEFYTAYTPYQPEVSQGTLQCLYEYQTMICELSGMDVSNASIYDGASALYEACILSFNYNKKTKILVSSAVYENYLDVILTLKDNLNLDIELLLLKDGITDLNNINEIDDVSAIIIQSPNKFGILESWRDVSKISKNSKTTLIAVSNPLSLALIESPGNSGADIYIGDGQVLGNYMNYGGPTLGIMSVKKQFIRKIPGRVIGRTIDKKGREGFVLTLQTREQHIRRENATSNICTNQSLLALRSLIYLSSIGKNGILDIIKLSFNKTQYLISEISKIDGFTIPFKSNIINEFLLDSDYDILDLINQARQNNIYLSQNTYNDKKLIQIAVTEKRTLSELNNLINFFKNYNA